MKLYAEPGTSISLSAGASAQRVFLVAGDDGVIEVPEEFRPEAEAIASSDSHPVFLKKPPATAKRGSK